MRENKIVDVEDITQKVPESDLAVVVRFPAQNGYIEVFKNGVVRLISPAGVVNAQFKELDKRDLLRQSYIQSLLAAGVTGPEFERALQAIARVDRRLARETDPSIGVRDLECRTETRLRAWAKEQGLDYDTISEETFMALVQRGVKEARGHT